MLCPSSLDAGVSLASGLLGGRAPGQLDPAATHRSRDERIKGWERRQGRPITRARHPGGVENRLLAVLCFDMVSLPFFHPSHSKGRYGG